jgi:membrane protein implicated in regulation of membrane protease activity
VTTAVRYALYQIPGIFICGLLLAISWRWTRWPVSWAVALLALWILKDALLYPLLRHAYERSPSDHGAGLIGLTAVVVEPLNPRGRVKVRGESWWAIVVVPDPESSRIVPVGTQVSIESLDGLRLVVRPVHRVDRPAVL